MATEDNNTNKELYSRPAVLETILSEFGQKPISFLELLGDGTGVEYYVTWLNINNLIVVERDKDKYEKFYKKDYKHFRSLVRDGVFTNVDLKDYFSQAFFHTGLDVINLDFCTYLWDNGKDNCTHHVIEQMFKYGAVANGGLVFFTFMIKGLGVNLTKNEVIKNRDDMLGVISGIASKYGYDVEEKLYYQYKSSKSTTMCNLGIKVAKRK